MEGAAHVVEANSGLRVSARLGRDFAVGALGEIRRKGAIFADGADPSAPDAEEVAKNKLPGDRQS